jgi:6-phosphogluconolactonase
MSPDNRAVSGSSQKLPVPEVEVADDVTRTVVLASARIADLASAAIALRGRFRIALAGGSTPRALYPRLVRTVDWSHTDVFFGDERAVPPDDPRSNYRMARETLLDPARVPEKNVHRWQAEAADLDAAARAYELALGVGGELDLAILGLGPDGHTASLFPGTTALHETERLAVAVAVPGLDTRRLTLTYPALLAARVICFLVTGAEKREALADVLRPDSPRPAARLVHRAGPVAIFCDRDALGSGPGIKTPSS